LEDFIVHKCEDSNADVVEFTAPLCIVLPLARRGVGHLSVDFDHDVGACKLKVDPSDRLTVATMYHLARRFGQTSLADDSKHPALKRVASARIDQNGNKQAYTGTAGSAERPKPLDEIDRACTTVAHSGVDCAFQLGRS
jgi:hypothetical protein